MNTKYKKMQAMISINPDMKLSVEYINGYLASILCAPDMIVPSRWLPLLLGDENEIGNFKEIDEAQQFIGLLMDLYNDIAKSIMDKTFEPVFSLEKISIEPDTSQSWCKGFLLGLNHWSDDFAADETTRSLIMPMLILADSKIFIDSMDDEIKNTFDAAKIEQLGKESLESIQENVVRLRYYNQKNLTNISGKTGRNDPCPCGSGKKYKKCCGM
jgi:uncharacterized protein